MTLPKSTTPRFFILTIVIGFLEWFLSPFLWDSWWHVGIFLLITASIGFFMPTRWWLWPIGLYLGQLIHLIYIKLAYPHSEAAAWWVLSIITITLGIIPSYFLCAIGRGVRALVKSKNHL